MKWREWRKPRYTNRKSPPTNSDPQDSFTSVYLFVNILVSIYFNLRNPGRYVSILVQRDHHATLAQPSQTDLAAYACSVLSRAVRSWYVSSVPQSNTPAFTCVCKQHHDKGSVRSPMS
eukprot:1194294-Prorocentrum_minimum.AAC.1